MSSGGASRPARAGGLGLLAVAVVAAVVGGITILTNGGGDETAAPTPSSAPGPPGSPSDTGTAGPGPSSSAPSTAPGSTTPPPGTPGDPSGTAEPTPGQPEQSGQPDQPGQPGGTPAPGGQDGSDRDEQASTKSVGVRVYNNSTIEGLATRAADELRDQGWKIGVVDNYSSGVIPTTTAYYRPGTEEQSAAKALAASFGMRAEPRFPGIEDAAAGVIVIVTNDYQGPVGK